MFRLKPPPPTFGDSLSDLGNMSFSNTGNMSFSNIPMPMPSLERGTTAASMLTLELGNEEAENWVHPDDDSIDLVSIKNIPKARDFTVCLYMGMAVSFVMTLLIVVFYVPSVGGTGFTPGIVQSLSILNAFGAHHNPYQHDACQKQLAKEFTLLVNHYAGEYVDHQVKLFYSTTNDIAVLPQQTAVTKLQVPSTSIHEGLFRTEGVGTIIYNQTSLVNIPRISSSSSCTSQILNLTSTTASATKRGGNKHYGPSLIAIVGDTCLYGGSADQTRVLLYEVSTNKKVHNNATIKLVSSDTIKGSFVGLTEDEIMTRIDLGLGAVLPLPAAEENEQIYRWRAHETFTELLPDAVTSIATGDLACEDIRPISTVKCCGDDFALLQTTKLFTAPSHDGTTTKGEFVFGRDWVVNSKGELETRGTWQPSTNAATRR